MKLALIFILSAMTATAAHAGCAALYRSRSKIYINVEGITASGANFAISRQDDGPDLVREKYVRAADLLEQANAAPNFGVAFNSMVADLVLEHPETAASVMEKRLQGILIDAEKQNVFCKDTDDDGQPDLTKYRKIKQYIQKALKNN